MDSSHDNESKQTVFKLFSVASLAKACCEMFRRDGEIAAWHEVPGTAFLKKHGAPFDEKYLWD